MVLESGVGDLGGMGQRFGYGVLDEVELFVERLDVALEFSANAIYLALEIGAKIGDVVLCRHISHLLRDSSRDELLEI